MTSTPKTTSSMTITYSSSLSRASVSGVEPTDASSLSNTLDETSGNRPEIGRITGTDDKFIPGASGLSWSVIHLTGSGDEFSVTGTIRYPDGQSWHFVSLLQVRDGKVWRESTYFGLPFDAPDWRSEAREAP